MDKIWSLFSGNSNILKFLLSPVRFTKCLGVRVPLRPPEKKHWCLLVVRMLLRYFIFVLCYAFRRVNV
jgi:hypothetical protein